MKCICGCGKKLRGRQADLNMRAGKVALELLAWDKARAAGYLSRELVYAERVLDRGAACYQQLLSAIHGNEDDFSTAKSDAWLEESRIQRRDRVYMTVKGGLFTRSRLTLTDEDQEQFDRLHPELTFSNRRPEGDELAARRVETLRGLHAEGVLTDQELATAEARALQDAD